MKIFGINLGGTAPQGPRRPTPELLERLEKEVKAAPTWPTPKPSDFPTAKEILALEPALQIEIALCLAERANQRANSTSSNRFYDFWNVDRMETALFSQILRRNLPFSIDHLVELFEWISGNDKFWGTSIKPVLGQLERYKERQGSLPEVALRALRKYHEGPRPQWWSGDKESKELLIRVDQLLGGELDPVAIAKDWPLTTFGVSAPEWRSLFGHCYDATSNQPSKAWLKKGAEVAAPLETTDLVAAFARAVGTINASQQQVDPKNSDCLRGFIWLLAERKTDEAARAIGDAFLVFIKKIPGVGPKSLKGANSCVSGLGQMNTFESLAQLSRIKSKIKYPLVAELVLKTLEEAARAQGTPLADLEEIVVPTFGMDDVGVLSEEFGDWTGIVRIVGTDETETTWQSADGKTQKSPPKSIETEHKTAIGELKKQAKEIEKALLAQRDRIESQLMVVRELPYPLWRERYLDHPLLGPMSRRLIWVFGEKHAGAWLDGRLVDAEDRPLSDFDETTLVRLWHPIGQGVAEVEMWRDWLDRHQISQPFKQAFREIYVLTDAERRTDVYSNRFAAHVLKQHQMNALMKSRGWRYNLQGGFDNYNVPYLLLKDQGLRVEFIVEPILDAAIDSDYMTEAGIAVYCSTDQVRFSELSGAAIPLDQIDARLFSEVLRDVDLFVGVASVGNDPNWIDSGTRPEGFNVYWQSYSFGDLSATAQTRKAVLEKLIPRLKIRDKAKIDGKFLVVTGSKRTYKIHLGSGNILMSPNDQYLCIVPGPGGRNEKVMLPFEGDGMLSIILSKAFMLADDANITDKTILSQLGRH